MNILLTNDDGIYAPGLKALARELSSQHKLTVVAPAWEHSGQSHAITLGPSLDVKRVTFPFVEEAYRVNGTPADCVKIALSKIIRHEVHLVVSGINDGLNCGVSVFYSGTIAAAIEAALSSVAGVALSSEHSRRPPWAKIAEHFRTTVLRKLTFSPGSCFSFNYPDPGRVRWQGVCAAQQSIQGFDERYSEETQKSGAKAYTLSGTVDALKEPENTDVSLLERGAITVTAIRKDFTDPPGNNYLRQVFGNMPPPPSIR